MIKTQSQNEEIRQFEYKVGREVRWKGKDEVWYKVRWKVRDEVWYKVRWKVRDKVWND
jgi:hypothetical protein